MINGNSGELIYKFKFKLSDGSGFVLNSNDEINKQNHVLSYKTNEKISTNSNLPIGVNTSNVLDLEIISKNMALIPENENSIYYGMMNDSAYIDIDVSEDGVEYYYGRYFVNSWKSNKTSDSPNKVVISATGLMGYISKFAVPNVSIKSGMYIKDYLLNVVYELNKILSDDKKIKVNEEDVNFTAFPTMLFCNLDTENIGSCFNSLSQSTLTNIYIDREGYLKTDYCCDDSEIDGKYNLEVFTGAECGTGLLVNYDSIKVNYSLGQIKDIETLASLYNQDVIAGDTEFNNISLGDSVYKINRIECFSEDGAFVNIKNPKYNKKNINLVVESDRVTKVNITVFGQRLDNTMLTKETEGKNKLEITNKVIPPDYIDKYKGNLEALIKIKNNSMKVVGYITPAVKLSDIVYVNVQNAMNVSGYYKVVEIDREGTDGRCTLALIKTFKMEYDIEALVFSYRNLLEKRLHGIHVNINDLKDLSESENTYVESVLADDLRDLRARLSGGN